jgi:hypothetical protein
MSTYNTAQEIEDAINENKIISGIVEIKLHELFESFEDFINKITNELIGENYGYLLENIDFTMQGCNCKEQTIFLEVIADATSLLRETDELAEFEEEIQ